MASSILDSSLLRFLYVKELVDEVFHHLLVLSHVIAWGDSFHTMHVSKDKIIAKHFRTIVEPFVPNNFECLCNVLYDSNAVMMGSCAITMLLGPGKHAPLDLNILVNHSAFDLIDAFFRFALSYEWVDHNVEPHDIFGGVLEHFVHYKMGNSVITVSSVTTNSLFKVVLAAPSTVDMVFMMLGGLCSFYPKFTLENNAILLPTGFLVDPEMSICSVWSKRFHGVDILALPSGGMCETTICLSLSIGTTNILSGTSCTDLTPFGDLQRPVQTSIANLPQFLGTIGHFCHQNLCFLIERHSYKSPMAVKALLYATAATSPQIVLVHLQEGKEGMERIDELEVNFWVNTLARNKFIVSISRYRKTFHGIPDHPSLVIPYACTIYREDPEGCPPPNTPVHDLFTCLGLDLGIKGNVLIVKHPKQDRDKVLDVTEGDLPLIHMLLDGDTLRKTHWVQYK
ncbi:hypothetical protein BDR05DRAFT_952584 [Suillus weaverae]|nr:hypothetical protein BDR05DRAFT_952584 [Suillus weaverae]